MSTILARAAILATAGVVFLAAGIVFLLGWICHGLAVERQENRELAERDRAWDAANTDEQETDHA